MAKQTNCGDDVHSALLNTYSTNRVYVFTMRRPKPSVVKVLMVNTTSTSADPLLRQLSPFFLGPVELYDNHISQNVENGWQYCKVFPEYVNDMNSYWRWAQ